MQDPLDRPSQGRIVLFRSRTGAYDCPAIVTATVDSLNPDGVALYERSGGEKGVPPLSGNMCVHLTVFTPGLPGQRGSAEDFIVRSPLPVQENVGGSYQEWDVSLADPEQPPSPGSWRWPMAQYPEGEWADPSIEAENEAKVAAQPTPPDLPAEPYPAGDEDEGLAQARQTQPESD